MRYNKAPNTVKAYAHAWQRFARWCAEAGRAPLPASSETVRFFVAWCIQSELKLSTIRINLASITQEHERAGLVSPLDGSVRALVKNAARALKEKPNAKKALPPELLRRIVQRLANQGSPIAVRDRAIVLLGFASGWRRSELASLELGDVFLDPRGIRLRLNASKTDQEGKGREILIPRGVKSLTCPVASVREWINVRGKWNGPLFCRFTPMLEISEHAINGERINEILKASIERVGENADVYGAHSLRAGMVTTAAENGASETVIMQRTGHKSITMMQRYVRPAQAWRVDPLAGVL